MNKYYQFESETAPAHRIRIFCDGAGARPDGTGSAYAWLREDEGTRKKFVRRVNGLTSNQAEYEAVLSALEALPEESRVLVLTDSQLVVSQLRGDCRTKDPVLLKLRSEIRALVRAKSLQVSFKWIPRRENLAGNLI